MYETYRLKEAQILLIDNTGVEYERFLLKELLGNEDWSFNVGLSMNYLAAGVGWKPDLPFRPIELHALIANSIEDTFNLRFNPKFGIGATIRIGRSRW